MKDLIGNYEQFITRASATLEQLGISKTEVAMMDHLCYRVETADRYSELKVALQTYAILISENIVNGRPIAVYEFHDYPSADGWTVPFIELPAPKSDSLYSEGLEHVEFVVIGSLNKFVARHRDVLEPFNSSKTINPDVKANKGDVTIKFHEQQLGTAVRIERDLFNGESR